QPTVLAKLAAGRHDQLTRQARERLPSALFPPFHAPNQRPLRYQLLSTSWQEPCAQFAPKGWHDTDVRNARTRSSAIACIHVGVGRSGTTVAGCGVKFGGER